MNEATTNFNRQKELQKSGFFRPNARSGVWVTFLLPIALYVSKNEMDMAAILALGMSIYSIIYAITLFPSLKSLIIDMEDKEELNWNNTMTVMAEKICIFIMLMLLVFFREIDGSVILSLAMMIFMQTLPMIWIIFEKSFTFGEGVIVLESGILYGTKFFFVNQDHNSIQVPLLDNDEKINIIADHILVSLLTLCLLFHFFKKVLNVPELYYAIGLASTCGFSYTFLWWKLGKDPLIFILNYINGIKMAGLMFAIWIICIGSAFLIVKFQSSQATTVTRKYFHALVVIVFTSGILIRNAVNFLYLSSIICFCSMLLTEFVRFHGIFEPLASTINDRFQVFKDEKDVGALVLTPLYLLIGVSSPIWITPLNLDPDQWPTSGLNSQHPVRNSDYEIILLLSGVLSIGIGDSFASIIGSKWGILKIPHANNNKTLGGLLASIISQVLVLMALHWGNFVYFRPMVMISIIITSLVETLSTQVDNLILPLLMFILNVIIL